MSQDPYKIAYQRERKARQIAEKMLDEKTREVYSTLIMIKSQFTHLQQKQKDLEAANTTLRTTQRQLVHSEKMVSLGQLAAGVAHEINNPVGFVLSNLTTLKDYTEGLQKLVTELLAKIETMPDSSAWVTERLEDADYSYIKGDMPVLISESVVGLKRVREIVDGLRSFARVNDASFTWEDLNALLENTVKVTWNELKYVAKVCFDLVELPLVNCSPGQLSQVFVNLIVNACHALKEVKRPGRIVIRTRLEGDRVRIEIEDNGPGIPKRIQEKIFDPFFTTKTVGVGTGLGLSVSHGLVEKHRGTIAVASVEGEGTTFSVLLPLDPQL